MRILLVHQSWPPGGGGSAVYTRDLARALAARHEVGVLVAEEDPRRGPGALTERECDGVRLAALNRLPSAGFESYRDPRVVEAVAPFLDRFRPELVHAGSLAGLSTGLLVEARRRGAPVVLTLHDFWPVCPLGQLLDLDLAVCPGPSPTRCLGCVGEQVSARSAGARVLGRALRALAPLARRASRASRTAAERVRSRHEEMRAVWRSADRVIAPSRFLRDRLAGLGLADAVHVPYGLPEAGPMPLEPDPAGRVRFGFLGAAIPSKGVHVLARAFRALGDVPADLRIHGGFAPYHGDRSYEARVRAILGDGAEAALRGPFAHEELGSVLSRIDVVVAPSLWEENAPLVVQEAFRARRPVIASGHGGLAELVRDGVDGLCVPPGDVAALAAALRRMALDDALRARLACNPPPVPRMDEHVAALGVEYAAARERFGRRAGRIGVVVPNRGRPDEAARAAGSALGPGLDVHRVVVEDGPAGRPVAAGPWELVELPERRGFAGAVNAGLDRLRAAGCDRLLLLNSDARLEPGALRLLAEALEDPVLAAVGPEVLREADGRVESRGVHLSLDSGRHRLLGFGERSEERAGALRVGGLSGSALMLSGAAWDAVGRFEESYFHGFEDADWCARAVRQGLELAVVPAARARHAGGLTLGRSRPDGLHYAARNHVRLVETLAPRRGAARWLRRGSIALLSLAHALRQTAVPRGAALRAVLAGTRAGWRGLGGPLGER